MKSTPGSGLGKGLGKNDGPASVYHDNEDSLRTWLMAMPKAELHVHLEGSTPPEMAKRLARRHNISIPGLVIDPASDEARYEIVGFDAFLSCYIALSQCLQDRQDFIDLIASVAGRFSEQNVRYAELTFTPMTHVGRGLSPEMLLESLAEGSALARTLHNIELAWVFDIVRCFPETSMATVELALRGRQSGLNLVALGIGGPEGPTWPGHAIAPAFDKARAESLAAAPHAGENHGPEGIWEALELFHPQRIGHGIRCVEDPKLMDELQTREICLEICPSSNLALLDIASLRDHPIQTIAERQLSWTLASDDPPLVNTTLTDEYLRCAQAFQWSPKRLHAIASQSFHQGFASIEQKQHWLEELDNFFYTTTDSSGHQGKDRSQQASEKS